MSDLPSHVDVWACARDNHPTHLSALLKGAGKLVDERNDNGETALHIAASYGHESVVELLLQHGANLVLKDVESGWTPLHRSMYHHHISTSLLLLRTAKVQCGRPFMLSYLYDLCDHEHRSAMALLTTSSNVQKTMDNGGHIYTFGKVDFQLGYYLPNADIQSSPKLVELPTPAKIVQVSASKYHTIAVSESGECFAWGFGKGGRLGTGNEADHMEPIKIQALTDIPIAAVACGDTHTLAVSTSHQLYSWGANGFGQLGHSTSRSMRDRFLPKRVDYFKHIPVLTVAASGCHSAVIAQTTSAVVYTWGSNKKGQLGYRDAFNSDQNVSTPRSVDTLLSSHPQSVLPDTLMSWTPTQLAVSDVRTCVLVEGTRNGRHYGHVYQCGDGSYTLSRVLFRSGNASGKILSDKWQPSCHQDRDHSVDHMTSISCALHHCMALSSTGDVYTWGHDELTSSLPKSKKHGNVPGTPQRIDLSRYPPIRHISASYNHYAVVTEEGDLVTWGGGQQGVLGHGAKTTWQPIPKRVEGVKKVTMAAAGHSHMAILVTPELPEDKLQRADSLLGMVEEEVVRWVDLSNVVMLYQYSLVLDTPALRRYCQQYLECNWDLILETGGGKGGSKERLEMLFDHLLEKLTDAQKKVLQNAASEVEKAKKNGMMKRRSSSITDKKETESLLKPIKSEKPKKKKDVAVDEAASRPPVPPKTNSPWSNAVPSSPYTTQVTPKKSPSPSPPLHPNRMSPLALPQTSPVLKSDGSAHTRVSSFSLNDFMKPKRKHSAPKAAPAWRSEPSLPKKKSLMEIQAEEEANTSKQDRVKSKHLDTVNSWGRLEERKQVDLAEVQRLQHEEAQIAEQRQILAEIERENKAAKKKARRKKEKEKKTRKKKMGSTQAA